MMTPRYPALLGTAYALFPLCALLSSYVSHRAIVPVCILVSVCVIISIGHRKIWGAFTHTISERPTHLFALLCIWLLLTTFWSAEPMRSALSVLKLCGTALVIWLLIIGAKQLSKRDLQRTIITLSIAVSIVVLLWGLDLISSGMVSFSAFLYTYVPIYGYYWFKAAVTLAVLSSLILSQYLWLNSHRTMSLIIILSTIGFAAAMNSRTLTVAIPLSFALAMFLIWLGRWRIEALIFTILSGTSLFVIAAGNAFRVGEIAQNLSASSAAMFTVLYRGYIWEFTAERIQERPIEGWGFGASQFVGKGHSIVDPHLGALGEAIPSHPHNFSLQVLLETGAVGYAIILALLWSILRVVDDKLGPRKTERFFFLILALIALALWHFNYSATASWWLHQLGFLATMSFIVMRDRSISAKS